MLVVSALVEIFLAFSDPILSHSKHNYQTETC